MEPIKDLGKGLGEGMLPCVSRFGVDAAVRASPEAVSRPISSSVGRDGGSGLQPPLASEPAARAVSLIANRLLSFHCSNRNCFYSKSLQNRNQKQPQASTEPWCCRTGCTVGDRDGDSIRGWPTLLQGPWVKTDALKPIQVGLRHYQREEQPDDH